MRCAISLASDNSSCMVLLPVMLENTDWGRVTPTAAQTSLTTDNRVMSGYLFRSAIHRHADQRFLVHVGYIAHRRLAGVRRDVLAELVERHLLELILGALRAVLLCLQILLEDGVARLQRLQLRHHLHVRR